MNLEKDAAIKIIKKQLVRGFEIVDDINKSPPHVKEPNIIIAENIVIFESLYY